MDMNVTVKDQHSVVVLGGRIFYTDVTWLHESVEIWCFYGLSEEQIPISVVDAIQFTLCYMTDNLQLTEKPTVYPTIEISA
ncbi:hypothetical protein AGOR_G00240700 [Albula goreensis]|uniref:Uncharacterized protein n=1 Tax=Albula goreensis TaxID=1534307 RepID=A0A8T3CK56_9TELE|nr:hypothetical protein AGOR_G00240700 [Albula goreensis]